MTRVKICGCMLVSDAQAAKDHQEAEIVGDDARQQRQQKGRGGEGVEIAAIGRAQLVWGDFHQEADHRDGQTIGQGTEDEEQPQKQSE